jgi:hypothetical protein
MKRLVRCFFSRLLLVAVIPVLLIAWAADVILRRAMPVEQLCAFWWREWTLAARMPNKEITTKKEQRGT